MHGAGTVSGGQLVALIASKISCALRRDGQLSHHQSQQRMRQSGSRVTFAHGRVGSSGRGGAGGGRLGGGKNGPSGRGAYSRTSMISWASVSVTATGVPVRSASSSRRSSSERSGASARST